MRPLDPRLLRFARSTRGFLMLVVVLGALTAVLVIVQARLLSSVIVEVTADGAGWAEVAGSVGVLALVFVARAAVAWAAQVGAARTSVRAKAELREASLDHILKLGPASSAAEDPGETSALVTRGIDALDGYYSRYLPQLVLAVIVPIAVLLTILGQDLLSAVIVAVTLPLIPVFMVLIGMYTRAQVDRQWKTLAALSGHFLDLVSGLPTLILFGRAKVQVGAIRAIGDRYRSTTMGVLRVTFLSSLALELIASIAVALVAVSVGLRLAEGQIDYRVGLFVLLLAPEAYLPLRLVGQHFHAAAEGLGAADRLFTILETPVPVEGVEQPPTGPITIHVDALYVSYPTRSEPAVAGVSFTAEPGTITALVGPSGSGKTTVLNALLGFIAPQSGAIRISDPVQSLALREVDCRAWRTQISWMPQRADLVSADLDDSLTIADALRLGVPDATDAEIWSALERVAMESAVHQRPLGLQSQLVADGSGMSIGQLQRLALARAILRRGAVVLLDEPTAAIDASTEQVIVDVVRQLAAAGATVVVVAHRPALVEVAHQIVRIAGTASVLPSPMESSAAAATIRGAGW